MTGWKQSNMTPKINLPVYPMNLLANKKNIFEA
jgi:hypothetical protein